MNMKSLHRVWIAGIAIAASLAWTAAAQTTVTGTGNADIDVAAVQRAVDQGGQVLLRGHFSFSNPPALRGTMPDLMATVLVTKEVTISGTWDEHGQMTWIDGGVIPFAVEAGGSAVRIERLRFVRPKLFAIFVGEVRGLAVDSCTIESVQPQLLPGTSTGLTSAVGIFVSTVMGMPTAERPGSPENVSGRLSIANNQISVNPAADHAIGIMVLGVGTAAQPLDVEISGNTVRDATLKGINVTQISGRARVEFNNVAAGAFPGANHGLNSGIHVGGSGTYRVAGNMIQVADPNGAGIRVRGYSRLGTAIEHATLTDNDVTMTVAEGVEYGPGSAGIEVMGSARGSVIEGNQIRGRAKIGLAVRPDQTGAPVETHIDRNDFRNLISPHGEGGKMR
jgi:hypothetical protein